MVQTMYGMLAHDIQEEVQQPLGSELVADLSSAMCGWAAAITDDGRRQSLRE
jgi:hypothetical protein